MSHPEAPARWSSATFGLPESLIAGLDEARALAPSADQVARMRLGLAPLLALSAAASAGGAAAGIVGTDALAKTAGVAAAKAGAAGVGLGTVGAKLLPVLLVVGGLVGAGWVWKVTANQKKFIPAAETGLSSAPLASPHSSPATRPSASPEAQLPAAPEVPVIVKKSHTPTKVVSTSGARKSADRASPSGLPALPPEARLLAQARTALVRSPAETLRLCRQHQAEFSHGILAQEREVLAVEALARLGRAEEARRRVARFRSNFAGSPHLPRLEALVSTQQPVRQ